MWFISKRDVARLSVSTNDQMIHSNMVPPISVLRDFENDPDTIHCAFRIWRECTTINCRVTICIEFTFIFFTIATFNLTPNTFQKLTILINNEYVSNVRLYLEPLGWPSPEYPLLHLHKKPPLKCFQQYSLY